MRKALPFIVTFTLMLGWMNPSVKIMGAEEMPTLIAAKVSQPPKIDGQSDDPAWRKAEPLTVTVAEVAGKDKGKSSTVMMKAVYTDTHICILTRWNWPRRRCRSRCTRGDNQVTDSRDLLWIKA